MPVSRGWSLLAIVLALVLFWCGLIAAALGVWELADAQPGMSGGEIAATFAVAAAFSAPAVWLFRRVRRDHEQEEEEWRAALRARRLAAGLPAEPPPGPPEVLARWTLGRAEWAAYASRELRLENRRALETGAAFLVFATLVARFQGAGWLPALGIGAAAGALVAALLWWQARGVHRADAAASAGEVVLTRDTAVIDGREHVLNDGRAWLARVRYLEDESPPVLELTVRQWTRRGPSRDEVTVDDLVRVPVPRGREDEARRVAGQLRRLRSGDNETDDDLA
jgi:membrane protein implicated in regulation of membrane protease activity